MPGLPAFLAAYPAIEIHLVESAAAADLIEGGLDLAIRIVEKPEPNLVVRRIATSRVVIVASPGYLAAAGTPAKPRDILHHRLVGFAPLAWRDTWRLGNETIAVQPRLLTGSSESLRSAALAGSASRRPSGCVADALVAGQLTRVLASRAAPSSRHLRGLSNQPPARPARARVRRPYRARPGALAAR